MTADEAVRGMRCKKVCALEEAKAARSGSNVTTTTTTTTRESLISVTAQCGVRGFATSANRLAEVAKLELGLETQWRAPKLSCSYVFCVGRAPNLLYR